MLTVSLGRTLSHCATGQLECLLVHGTWRMVCRAQGHCQGDLAGLDSSPWWNCIVCAFEEPDGLIEHPGLLDIIDLEPSNSYYFMHISFNKFIPLDQPHSIRPQ
jgi:hypothetical protein